MIYLRLSPTSHKTFCRIAVTHDDERNALVVVDPLKADCVPCLGEAVAHHEMHAKLAETRLRAIELATRLFCPGSCSKGCIFNPCRKSYAP